MIRRKVLSYVLEDSRFMLSAYVSWSVDGDKSS